MIFSDCTVRMGLMFFSSDLNSWTVGDEQSSNVMPRGATAGALDYLLTQHFLGAVPPPTSAPSPERSGWKPVAFAANQDLVVPLNGQRVIELIEEFTIPDGESELLLPIDVAPPRLTVDGDAPPKVVAVNTTALDGTYGAGQDINITVEFTTVIEWRPRRAGVTER